MIAYKVVYYSKEFDELWSCSVGHSYLRQVYKPGVLVECKLGGFLLFDSPVHANDYSHGVPYNEIWKCDVEGQVKLPPFGLFIFVESSIEAVKELWGVRSVPSFTKRLRWPLGTLAFKKVTLKEKVS